MPNAFSQHREIFGFIPKKILLSFSLVTMLFLIWGIPVNMNDILIKQFMKSFELTRFQAGLIQSAFYIGYFFLAVWSGLIMKRYSYKVGLIIGLLLFATGYFMFLPAALAGKYGLFLFALFIIASGLTFAMAVPLICYSYIAYFAFIGSKTANEETGNYPGVKLSRVY